MSSYSEILRVAAITLTTSSPSPQLDARVLLTHLLGCTSAELIANASALLSDEQSAHYAKMIAERAKGVPVAYITGEKEFFGRTFFVTPDVLIPRPDTELLIELAVNRAKAASKQKPPLKILDLGTGSGCIAISVVAELLLKGIAAQCDAVDSSEAALNVAKRNAEQHGVQMQIHLHHGSWFVPLQGKEGGYDLILSNPPYIGEDERAETSPETSFEPQSALYSGSDGLTALREIFARVKTFLRPESESAAFFEIGYRQGERVMQLATEHGFTAQVHRDLAGSDRVVECLYV